MLISMLLKVSGGKSWDHRMSGVGRGRKENPLTNCLPHLPPFAEMKKLRLFPVRSLVSLEIDLITKLLSLVKTLHSE